MSLPTLRTTYSSQTTGKPQNYAIRGESLVLGPEPDTTYSLKLAYFAKYAALSTTNTTNVLIADHPDVYLYGALAELHLLLHDTEQAATFAAKRDEAIAQINLSTVNRKAGVPTRIRSPYVV